MSLIVSLRGSYEQILLVLGKANASYFLIFPVVIQLLAVAMNLGGKRGQM